MIDAKIMTNNKREELIVMANLCMDKLISLITKLDVFILINKFFYL
jgi:hypothetical protein